MTEQQQALHQDRLCRTSARRTRAQQADESAFLYARSLPVAAPTVAIVTVTEVADALLLTAESIAQQSLQDWRWLIVAGEGSLAVPPRR